MNTISCNAERLAIICCIIFYDIDNQQPYNFYKTIGTKFQIGHHHYQVQQSNQHNYQYRDIEQEQGRFFLHESPAPPQRKTWAQHAQQQQQQQQQQENEQRGWQVRSFDTLITPLYRVKHRTPFSSTGNEQQRLCTDIKVIFPSFFLYANVNRESCKSACGVQLFTCIANLNVTERVLEMFYSP